MARVAAVAVVAGTSPTPAFLIRPARLADRAGLEAIAARTWDGRDYLPRVFEAWVGDPHGEFYVGLLAGAEGDEHVVGAGKITRLGSGEWWLEGLRVHPDFQRRGLGRLLHQYGLRRALALAASDADPVLRLATDAYNESVHKVAAETGFVLVGRYLRYEARTYTHQFGAAQFHRLSTADVPTATDFLGQSPHFEACQRGSMGRAFKAHLLTADRLSQWSAEDRLYGWYEPRASGALTGVVVITPTAGPFPQTDELDVSYLDAAPGMFAALARAVRGLGGRLGYARLRTMLPIVPGHLVAIEQGGWRRPRDNSGQAVLFSRPLTGGVAGGVAGDLAV